MNHYQLLAFLIYCGSIVVTGISIYTYINKDQESFLNRSVFLGEVFLLGSILVIGELLTLSMVGLYKTPYMWGCVALNYLFLMRPETRKSIANDIFGKGIFSIPMLIFSALLGVFVFRNYFFLVTGDSHNIYLLVQKIWLMNGTSLVGDEGFNIGFFTPQFNAVPYGLGIALFGQEVLFPQFINISWRIVVLLLVFGYTSYRFNGYYGLIASILVLFDEHFFYSGANSCVIINGAVIAFLFSSIYNFWESRKQNSSFRFLLALVFLSQLMANKYQLAYMTFFIIIMGFIIQPNFVEKVRGILRQKRLLIILGAAIFITSLWYIKNFIVTGCPTFPIFAGQMGIFNWTPEMAQNFSKVFCVLTPTKFLKFFSYFWIWHGVLPSKLLFLVVVFLPIIILVSVIRTSIDKEAIFELGYWLGLCLLGLASVCLVCFCDPRIYRYLLPLFSFSFVYSIVFILQKCLGLNKKFIFGVGSIMLCFVFLGLTIYAKKQIPCQSAGIKDNIGVILNKIHAEDVKKEYYPKNFLALEAIKTQSEKFQTAAWDIGRGGDNPFSAFWLPVKPQVGLWSTTVIRWDSYNNEDLIVKDLKDYGLQWVISGEGNGVAFLTLEDYAQKASQQERYPSSVYYNYGFPQELADIQH